MKAKHLILVLFVFSIFNGFSQKIDKQELEFEYIQLPKAPLDKSIVNYSSEVILTYEADILAEKQRAQDEYDKAMEEYPQQVADAQAKYDEAMAKYEEEVAAWDEKSTASKLVEKKILNEDNKPRKPGSFYPPSKPYLREVRHERIFNKEMLANTYLKLYGFNNSPENALRITATLYGFENLDVEVKTKEGSEYNAKTKESVTVVTSWYEVSYKHPINLKIESPFGDIIIDETFTQFNEYQLGKSSVSKGSHPSGSKEDFLESFQSKVVEDNMKYINEYINNNYGFPVFKRKSLIYRVETKKLNYDEYQKAYEYAASGYNLVKSNLEEATEKINNAIQIWDNSLAEGDPSDKKARINSDIMIITLFNMTEAYIWTINFSKAEECINKIVGLSPSRKEEKLIDEYRELLKDQKERWVANNN